jgi:DNA mismatch repair protein MutS
MFTNQSESPLAEALQGIKPDDLTPRQALDLLYTLKNLANEETR